MSETQTTKTPRHLWIVGIVALMWSLVGAREYVMTQTKNEEYMSQFTPEQLEFFYCYPSWLVAFWAVAVWGGVLGAVLVISFLCMVATTIRDYGFAGAAEIVGGVGIVFGIVALAIALALVLYARSMARRGVLV